MRLSSGPLLPASFLCTCRRAFALAMLVFVFEALCVLGRAAGPVELRVSIANTAFVLLDRPKGRAA
jgi:hypothetical protein